MDNLAIAATGQHLDNAGGGTAAATDYTVTVADRQFYLLHAVNGVMYFGIAACTTDANILWVVGAGQTLNIQVPEGYTTLHYMVDTAGVEGRLSRMRQ